MSDVVDLLPVRAWVSSTVPNARGNDHRSVPYTAKPRNDSNAGYPVRVELQGEIVKTDPEHGRVYGWAYTITKNGEPVADHSGDIIDTPETKQALEEAFVEYVKDHRTGDLDHETFGVSKLIEAVYVDKDKADAMGASIEREGLWVGYEIDRSTAAGERAWELVKTGERPAFSIVGVGEREAI